MKKEVIIIILISLVIFISACTNYPLQKSPTDYIDHFNLGEDQTSHNFVCYNDNYCKSSTNFYDCDGDKRIRMGCANNYKDGYIELEIKVVPNEVNYLLLQRPNGQDIYGNKRTKFEFFINDVSQGVFNDYGPACEYFNLEIPTQNSEKIKIKFKNVLEESTGEVSCGKDFQYTHLYVLPPDGYIAPYFPESCVIDEDCPDGYVCSNMECVESNQEQQDELKEQDDQSDESFKEEPVDTTSFLFPTESDYSNYIDHFDLGEDQTSHNFVCYQDTVYNEYGVPIDTRPCRTSTNAYDCDGDKRIRMGCHYVNRTCEQIEKPTCANIENNYIEFTMSIAQNENNILTLKRPNFKNGEYTFEWFINNKSQGIVNDNYNNEACGLFRLEIPQEYSNQEEITFKFKNVLWTEDYISCSTDFQYVHAYTFKEGDFPVYENTYDNINVQLETEKEIYEIGEEIKLK